MRPKFNDPERKWKYVLIQIDSGEGTGKYTYRPDYSPLSFYKGTNIIAVFKVKLKDNRNWLQKIFDFGRYRKQIEQHLTISQLHPC